MPAPRRGELVRLLGEELRAAKTDLGRLVTLEAGKIASEGLGEVQEMIDICDYAVGLSRQLYGLTLATERSEHRMMETWHPLGVVGVISAFNFPVAVWSWNAALALRVRQLSGLEAVGKDAAHRARRSCVARASDSEIRECARRGLAAVLIGGREVGEALVDHPRVPIVSATGSTAMGRQVGPRLAARFARSLLELGGNNAAIVCPTANLDLALRGIAFAAMGTAGQRCTTLRRLFVHKSVYDKLVPRLKAAYASVPIGDPREAGTLVGPLIDEARVRPHAARARCGSLGGRRGHWRRANQSGRRRRATCGRHSSKCRSRRPSCAKKPLRRFSTSCATRNLSEAIRLQNDVPQGLSSSVFTNDLREAERFTSAEGSDCGIANVNIGPSGAEIGGAFGGEKETGGGREAGSDSWKAYMRRATNTVNYGATLPLAQGVKFDVQSSAVAGATPAALHLAQQARRHVHEQDDRDDEHAPENGRPVESRCSRGFETRRATQRLALSELRVEHVSAPAATRGCVPRIRASTHFRTRA